MKLQTKNKHSVKVQMATKMQQHRVNNNIIAAKVIIISPSGENKGLIALNEARIAARALNLDLVQVSPDQAIPIVKICDYKKFLFDLEKKENHKKSSAREVKQIAVSCNISANDLNTKIKNTLRILSDGDSVEFIVKPNKAWEPDARIRALTMAFDMAKKVRAMFADEKGVKTTEPVKQERAAKFYVNSVK